MKGVPRILMGPIEVNARNCGTGEYEFIWKASIVGVEVGETIWV